MRQSECNCVAPIPLNTNSFSEARHRAPFVLSLPPPARPLLSCGNLLTESASANSESLNFFSSRLFSVKHLFILKSRAISFSFSLFSVPRPPVQLTRVTGRRGRNCGWPPSGTRNYGLIFHKYFASVINDDPPPWCSVVDKVMYEGRTKSKSSWRQQVIIRDKRDETGMKQKALYS